MIQISTIPHMRAFSIWRASLCCRLLIKKKVSNGSLASQYVSKLLWTALCMCCIKIFFGPLDIIVHDARAVSMGFAFQAKNEMLLIQTKSIPVESANSMNVVERYHNPFRRVSVLFVLMRQRFEKKKYFRWLSDQAMTTLVLMALYQRYWYLKHSIVSAFQMMHQPRQRLNVNYPFVMLLQRRKSTLHRERWALLSTPRMVLTRLN